MNRSISLITSLLAVSALALAGCSSTSSAATGQASSQPSAAPSTGAGAGQQSQGNGQQGRGPDGGTFGLIADVSGGTLQVQGTGGQTAVTFTDKTTFTSEVKGKTSDLATGLCVTGMGTTSDTTITASRLTLTAATSEGCVGGPGGSSMGAMRPGGGQAGAPGERPSGAPTDMPSGAPTDLPSGAPAPGGAPSGGTALGGDGKDISFLSGQITKIDGDSVTVKSTGSEAKETTFKVNSDTSIAKTEKSTSKAAKVGVCAVAKGDTDSTGAVTATSIRLSEATDGSCSMGGGRR